MGKTVLPNQFFGRPCWQLLLILSIFADLRNFCLTTITQPAKTTWFNIRLRLSINYVLAKRLPDLGPVPSFSNLDNLKTTFAGTFKPPKCVFSTVTPPAVKNGSQGDAGAQGVF